MFLSNTQMFPTLMTKIPRRRKPEEGEAEIDMEDCFFALPTPPTSAFNFFDDVPGWDVHEDLSFKDLSSFSSDEMLVLRGKSPKPLERTASCDSIYTIW